jgi:hypothetical protein
MVLSNHLMGLVGRIDSSYKSASEFKIINGVKAGFLRHTTREALLAKRLSCVYGTNLPGMSMSSRAKSTMVEPPMRRRASMPPSGAGAQIMPSSNVERRTHNAWRRRIGHRGGDVGDWSRSVYHGCWGINYWSRSGHHHRCGGVDHLSRSGDHNRRGCHINRRRRADGDRHADRQAKADMACPGWKRAHRERQCGNKECFFHRYLQRMF